MAKASTIEVTSFRTVEFPKLNFSIRKGETKELPKDKEAQDVILAHPHIIRADLLKK